MDAQLLLPQGRQALLLGRAVEQGHVLEAVQHGLIDQHGGEAIQGMLKDQIKELSDSDWQYYLDKYYGRSRLYPADGSQPLEDEPIPDGPMTNEVPTEENDKLSNTEVDNNAINEVNSVQETEDNPEVLAGDSPVKESMQATEENTERRDGPVIIFPDDLKDN